MLIMRASHVSVILLCIYYYVWSMKWRVPGQEVDQSKLGERFVEIGTWIEQGLCHGSY